MKKYDSWGLGVAIGVSTSIISLLFFYFLRFTAITLPEYVQLLIENRYLFAPIVSLAGLPNLVIFYLFLNREKYKSARGVILATFILVAAVLIIKFVK